MEGINIPQPISFSSITLRFPDGKVKKVEVDDPGAPEIEAIGYKKLVILIHHAKDDEGDVYNIATNYNGKMYSYIKLDKRPSTKEMYIKLLSLILAEDDTLLDQVDALLID